jgi:hypothetical protein
VEQLRQVFAELNAVTVRKAVAFPRYYELFGPDGRLMNPEGPDGATKALLDQLLWWGSVVHDGRLSSEYTPAG